MCQRQPSVIRPSRVGYAAQVWSTRGLGSKAGAPGLLEGRPAKMVALEKADALLTQDRGVTGGFDALRHSDQAEGVRQSDQMAQEDLVIVTLGEIAHERAVDLHDVDVERLHVAERGEAGAEIVERHA